MISAFRKLRLLIISTVEVSPSWSKTLMHRYKLLTFSGGLVRAKRAAAASALQSRATRLSCCDSTDHALYKAIPLGAGSEQTAPGSQSTDIRWRSPVCSLFCLEEREKGLK